MKPVAFISHPDCLLHDMGPSHPECPDRLKVIEIELVRSGVDAKLQHYQAPLVTREQLLRVHTEDYINYIFQHAPKKGLIALDPDTAMNPYSLQAALRAAGAVVNAVDLVMENEVRAAFCNVRPPGHHAEHNQAMGFCFFDNIAVGAAHALEHHQLKRVAIVDFDVHHGNGTEDIFRHDQRVLFCSSFQHPFYPDSGADTRSDHIVNIPLAAGTTGADFRNAVAKQWFQAIYQFQPEMIFFSAGFDAHEKDMLAGLRLHEEDYAWVTHEVKKISDQVCGGKIVSALEGGYALDVLGACVVAHVNEL